MVFCSATFSFALIILHILLGIEFEVALGEKYKGEKSRSGCTTGSPNPCHQSHHPPAFPNSCGVWIPGNFTVICEWGWQGHAKGNGHGHIQFMSNTTEVKCYKNNWKENIASSLSSTTLTSWFCMDSSADCLIVCCLR